jgi:Lrp/AsnC ligand binding domain
MDREDATTIARFEQGLAEVAEVRHAQRLFGDPDYLVRVATADLDAYQTLRDEKLATLPGVQRLTSTIVMKTHRRGAALPPLAAYGRSWSWAWWRSVATAWARSVLRGWPEMASRNGTRSRAYNSVSVVATTVAVRGTSRSRAISPK